MKVECSPEFSGMNNTLRNRCFFCLHFKLYVRTVNLSQSPPVLCPHSKQSVAFALLSVKIALCQEGFLGIFHLSDGNYGAFYEAVATTVYFTRVVVV